MKKGIIKLLLSMQLVACVIFFEARAQLIITKNEPIILANNQAIGDHYPSVITVSNISTKISGFLVAVNLSTVSATPVAWDVILEGPEGQVTYLFSDVGNAQSITNVTLILVDIAPPLPTPANLGDFLNPVFALKSGFFRPTDGSFAVDTFPAPAPVGPYATNLAIFGDTNPNGDWKLYVTSPIPVPPPSSLTVKQWSLIIFPYSQNDYLGDGGFHYVAKKGKKVYVVNQTNVFPISKATPPSAIVKAKIVGGADLDGDHISDLIIKKGKTIQGLKGPTFTTPTHTLQVKGMKPVASGDFNGDFIPDLYLQKKTSLYVAINTSNNFEAPKLIADKTLPKKFKVFGALSGRSQPTVLAQDKTTIAQLDGPTFATANQIVQLTSKKIKAGAVGQYVGDYTGSTIILQQKKTISFHSPFAPEIITPLVTNSVKGIKLAAPR
ncbi:MAG: hypothetical protein K1X66_07425 [Verrucomicrobiae bacterium]|nr:hypothetical protein [Verrucomicrobiae bacterium]